MSFEQLRLELAAAQAAVGAASAALSALSSSANGLLMAADETSKTPKTPKTPKTIQWVSKNPTIFLASQDKIDAITALIDAGKMTSPVKTVSWSRRGGSSHGKHHPTSAKNRQILEILEASSTRSVSFERLARASGLPETGTDAPQNYLRELLKMGVISI